jgi:hypothetical protein
MNKIITRHRVMEILWLAIVLYSVGLGLVLHFRPALMFQENGAWKEFGYQRSPRHTLFPFWLFAVTWAFISYVIATSVSWVMPVGAAVAYSNGIESTFMSTPADEEDEESEDEMPVSSVENSVKKPRSGYYVRDESIPADEMPRYIYHGPDRPE